MKSNSWMPFNPGDYLRDTGHLTTIEHGAYLLLLFHAWTHDGVLSNDDARLRNITKLGVKAWNTYALTIRSFFYISGESGEVLRHRRIDRELAKSGKFAAQRSKAGKASAAKRSLQRELNARSTDVEISLDSRSTHIHNTEERKNPTGSKESPPSPNGSRLATDWHPGDSGIKFARDHGLNPEPTLATFRDYWCSKAGKDGRKLDWQATWRNWCRRDKASRPGNLFPDGQADNWNQF